MKRLVLAALVGAAVVSSGCKGEDETKPKAGGASAKAEGAKGDKAKDGGDDDHGRLPIGEKTIGDLKLVATMDKPIKPGDKDAAFDLTITGGKPKRVTFWVGTEEGEESAKAKAEIEDPEGAPDNWHTHAELPQPLPAGSKFWTEVEPPTGETFTVSFDLKTEE